MTTPGWLERVIARATVGDTPEDAHATARRVLAAWQRAAGGRLALRRRLRWSGDGAVRPTARLTAAVAGDPSVAWDEGLRELVAALTAAPGAATADLMGALQPIGPAGRAAVRVRLHARGSTADALLGPAAWAALEHALATRVSKPLRPAWDAWCAEHPLTRLAGEESVRAALQQELAASGLRPLFERFPVAARLAGTVYRLEIEAQVELLERLERDLPEIRTRWNRALSDDEPPVRNLQLHLADAHRGGRAVARVDFADGTRIAAKPRSLSVEQALEAHGANRDADRALRLLARPDYGWVEWIAAEPPRDAPASTRLHRRLGAMIVQAAEIDLCDLHAGNVILADEHAFIVDPECLRPGVATCDAPGATRADTLTQRVLGSGLLPRWRRRQRDGRLDLRGLLGTNLPSDDVHALVAGFRESLSQPSSLDLRSALAQSRARYLLRPTAAYGLVQRRLLRPDALEDIRLFDALADTLTHGWTQSAQRPTSWPLIEAERRALFRFDVPAFDYVPTDTHLRACDGTQVDAFFAAPPADAWIACSQASDVHQREADAAHVSALLTQLLGPTKRPSVRPGLAGAAEIARFLAARALTSADGSPTWLGYESDPAEVMLRPALTNDGLYDGRTGIGLFLLAAQRHCADGATLGSRLFDTYASAAPTGSGIGWAHGLAGRTIALRAAARIARRSDWHDAAARSAHELARRVHQWADDDLTRWERLDVFSGAAGVALALASEPRELDAACALLERLRTWLDQPASARCGLMHGLAGIALAAGRVAAAFAMAGRLEDSARAWRIATTAIAAENRLIDPATGIWRPRQPAFDGSWCNHTPGIALSRSTLLRCAKTVPSASAEDRATLAHDLARALAHVQSAPAARFDLLCCGQLGRIASLLLSSAEHRAPEAQVMLDAWLGRVTESGWNLDATPADAWLTPSLGRGLAGAGWILLASEDAVAGALLAEVLGFRPGD